MVAVFGAPEIKNSYPFSVSFGKTWEECLYNCENLPDHCHMASVKRDRCSLYTIGDYQKISNDGFGDILEDEVVGFKLDIPNGECLGSASSTLASQTGSYLFASSSGLGITSFGISVTPESYDVSYNYDNECNRPYRLDIPCKDVTSFLEAGSGHKNYAMQMMRTGNTVKLDIPNGKCLGSASDTIASQTGYASSLATDITGIGISVTSESKNMMSYDVSYNYVDECNRPYRTGIPCEKTCPSRMYNFRGSVLMKKGDGQANGPWNQCVTKCARDENCILAASDNYTACVLFGIETFTELTLSDSYEIDSTSTDYLAIKVEFL
ncbi:Protein CBG07188 [Caenorhabditis briggsae]|uniref:Protein CBG07188 n=1 Tax=Caenorhabditis briggsae TaxID=6238 RepID=A8X3I4_CAEBR|nr:Protein CBG07188 [Caenorhabditis briggsae]CAP27194.1 Protein CBG07188 [Caenorhabditis briggsae]